jgi:predicted acyl esterase
MHVRLPVALSLAALALALPSAAGAYVPANADWSEQYITEPDGTVLHADVLKPKGLAAGAKTPVIITVSPYTNHSGQQGPLDYNQDASGPSPRFQDFLDGADPIGKGYTYVIVDLPGFGGSSGCTEWGGPSEQAAVKNSIEWAAAQPWSTGKVGTYGKSYDGWTGLMAIAQQPKGLGAVVAAEPVYSGYRYEFTNGVRMTTSLEEGALFDAINATPGTTSDTAQYETNSAPLPHCLALNVAAQLSDDPENASWKVRNLIPALKGETTPLFLTQGFLEDNTKPDGAYEVFNGMAGPKHAWFGEWDHVRGAEVCTTNPGESAYCSSANKGKLKMGRTGWFDEVMRFYDQHLRGVAPAVADPTVVVQSGNGRWRSAAQWPPADSRSLLTRLKAGTYADDNTNAGTGPNGGKGIWTISDPLPYDVHFAGEPHFTADVTTTLPNANLVVDVYDLDAAGKATLISRGAQLVRSAGIQSFDLYGQDWPIAAGHRLGVLVSGSNSEWWTHVPTRQTVTVNAPRITLPFLRVRPTYDQPGTAALKLVDYKSTAPFAVPAATIAAANATFTLPDPLEPTG